MKYLVIQLPLYISSRQMGDVAHECDSYEKAQEYIKNYCRNGTNKYSYKDFLVVRKKDSKPSD